LRVHGQTGYHRRCSVHALHDQRSGCAAGCQSVLDLNIGVRTRVRQSDATGVTVPTERVDGRGREMVVTPSSGNVVP
jgi:hypothetical protein